MLKIQKTVYPLNYDLNGTRDRHSRAFTKSFNNWRTWLDMRTNAGCHAALKKAKQILKAVA